MEYWKDIIGYNGYQVSNFGMVKNKFNNKLLKPIQMPNGYLKVNLYKNKLCKQFYIHRLVAQAFIPNTNNLPCVNHKSEIKTDNRVENLEWADYDYNIHYGSCIKRGQLKQSQPILQIDDKGKIVAEYISAKQAERDTNSYFKQASISACCRGIYKQYKGFIFKYK